MPITRAKAEQLLNQREMALYDDSRANALRGLDAKALATRIERARTARDRAKQQARAGGRGTDAAQRGRDKAALLADILARFQATGKTARAGTQAGKAAVKKKVATRKTATGKTGPKKKAATKKAAAKKAAAKKVAGRKATAKKVATKKTTSKVVKKAAGKKVAANKAAPRKTAAKASTRKSASPARKATPVAGKRRSPTRRRITPEQALAQTHALLEAKHAHDAEPRPWQALPNGPAVTGQAGFQSDDAAGRANQLHAAESRMSAIQGSMGTRDRINQGKRDHRNQGNDG